MCSIMIVIPLIVNHMIFSLNVSFKKIQQKKEVLQADQFHFTANDLVVGKASLKELEDFNKFEQNHRLLTQFIRKHTDGTIPKSVYITTSNYPKSDFYDVYKIALPPKNSSSVGDLLYGMLSNDLRLKNPENDRGKVVSLKHLGIDTVFNPFILADLEKIKSMCSNHEEFLHQLINDGYQEQLAVLDFLDTLEFQIIDQTMISLHQFATINNSFQAIGDKLSRGLSSYQQIASDNFQIYTTLAKASHIIYDKPLSWPKLSVQQQKILEKKVV